jgi:DNA-binding NtrC family response regulator
MTTTKPDKPSLSERLSADRLNKGKRAYDPLPGQRLTPYHKMLREAERNLLMTYLKNTRYVPQAAKILGVSSKLLRERCLRLDIPIERSTKGWRLEQAEEQPTALPDWMEKASESD